MKNVVIDFGCVAMSGVAKSFCDSVFDLMRSCQAICHSVAVCCVRATVALCPHSSQALSPTLFSVAATVFLLLGLELCL